MDAAIAGYKRRTGPLEPAADYAPVVKRLADPNAPVRLATFPQVLAELSDVTAGVALAEVVAAGPRRGDKTPQIDDGRWLLAHVQRQLDSMDRFLAKRLAAPFEGRNRLSSVDEVRADLGSADGNRDALARDLLRHARTYEQRLLALLRTLRRDGNRIRSDAAAELRRLGPKAAHLERLDGALRRATAAEAARRDGALAARVGELAAEAMHDEAFELAAEGLGAIRADAMLRLERNHRRGALRGLRQSIDRILRAVAAEERALLVHLVQGAIDAEGDEFGVLAGDGEQGEEA